MYLKCALIVLFAFPLLSFGQTAPATVTTPIYCLETDSVSTSQASVYTCVDSSGNLIPMAYPFNNQILYADGAFIFGDTMYYCGDTFAEEMLTYAFLTNQ